MEIIDKRTKKEEHWQLGDGKYLAFKEWWWRKTKHGNKVN